MRSKMECFYHIWPGAAQSAPFSIDRIQNHLQGIVRDDLFSILQLLSPQMQRYKHISKCYFQGKCSHVFYSLFPQIRSFIVRTCQANFTESNHHHFFHFPNVRRNFHWDIFSLKTATLKSKLLHELFPEQIFYLSKPRVSSYLSSLSSFTSTSFDFHITHLIQ